MMKYVVAALVLVLVVAQTDAQWQSWKVKFGKVYDTAQEEMTRRGYWEVNYRWIEAENALSAAREQAGEGNVAYYALNSHSDNSPQVISSSAGFDARSGFSPESSKSEIKASLVLPTSLDWRPASVITSSRDQGTCSGGSWAFAIMAYFESFFKIKKNQTMDLSEQWLIDCAIIAGCDCTGCNTPDKGINFTIMRGAANESDFPLNSQPAGMCSTTLLNSVPAHSWIEYTVLTDAQLKTLLTGSPVIARFSGTSAFYSYASGTHSCANTSSITVSHLNEVVQVVGYDRNGSYIIKFSYGITWGVNGFATINSTLDCGLKLVVYELLSTLPHIILLPDPPKDDTKSEWNTAFMFVLAFLSMAVLA